MLSAEPAHTVEAIDPRSPRFAAAITSIVLAAIAILGPVWGLGLLIVQVLAFGAGSLLGLRYQPYGWVFRTLVRPRLAPPAQLEDARPPRFAQTVGLAFTVVALVGAVAQVGVLFWIAIGFALVAALLNAVFDFCLGCEFYLLGRRVLRTSRPAAAA